MSTTSKSEAPLATTRLYARVWRWHFFAAVIVIPFVLWQAVTGTLYLWHRELADWAHPELLRVEPSTRLVSYEQQLASVLAHQPRERLEAIELSDEATRSTAFFFRDDNGLPYPAFVNPHSGEYLGAVSSTHWLRGLSRGLHGGWPINPVGSYLLELGASWAIVMALTGLYLWWPRNVRGLAGVLYPRLNRGPRTLWRDLHATVGVYFALILLAFLVSALPWTTLWGGKVLGAIQTATNQESPTAFFFAGGADHHHATAPGEGAHDHSGPAARSASAALSIDDLVAQARAHGARGVIELQPRFDGSPVNLRDDHPRAPQEVWMQLDGFSGAVLTRVTWADMPAIPRFVSLGIDLHEGRFFGRANQIFNTVFALALVWLSVSGFIGWYRRRPHGGLAAPPKFRVRYPKAVLATGVALCIGLPLLGASVLAIALIDRAFGRLLPAEG
jgi:uncharacterized iron-regulated membrane protein